MSFDCAPGSVVALVGPSGSGKSSCLALLQHFYAPTAGRVLLDGVPVADRDHDWLHTKVAMVGQEPVLFARSIAKNVAYGLEDLPHLAPSPEKIRTCLAMANAQTFIDALPDGVDTDVGERGADTHDDAPPPARGPPTGFKLRIKRPLEAAAPPPRLSSETQRRSWTDIRDPVSLVDGPSSAHHGDATETPHRRLPETRL